MHSCERIINLGSEIISQFHQEKGSGGFYRIRPKIYQVCQSVFQSVQADVSECTIQSTPLAGASPLCQPKNVVKVPWSTFTPFWGKIGQCMNMCCPPHTDLKEGWIHADWAGLSWGGGSGGGSAGKTDGRHSGTLEGVKPMHRHVLDSSCHSGNK